MQIDLVRTTGIATILLVFVLIASGCRTSALRYAGISKQGWFESGSHAQHLHPAPWLFDWFRMSDETGLLIITPSGELYALSPVFSGIPSSVLSLDKAGYASFSAGQHLLSVGSVNGRILYAVPPSGTAQRAEILRDAADVAPHPLDPVLAVKPYLGPRLNQEQDVIAIVQTDNPTGPPLREFRFNLAVSEITGWSTDGQVLAATIHGRQGASLHYLFPETGRRESSNFQSTARYGAWSPVENRIVFSGVESSLHGYDLYLESFPTDWQSGKPTLLNLTESDQVDEISPAWSPDGTKIAYVRISLSEDGQLRQELYQIDLSSPNRMPTPLTVGGPDHFAARPIWISNSQVVFMNYSTVSGAWTVRVVDNGNGGEEELLVIPESWLKRGP